MRLVGFGLGLVLALAAAATAIAQIFSLIATGGYTPVSPGSIWYAIHANSLVGLQALVENRLSPAFWPPIVWLLQLPAWLVLGIPAALLLLAGRRHRRGGFG